MPLTLCMHAAEQFDQNIMCSEVACHKCVHIAVHKTNQTQPCKKQDGTGEYHAAARANTKHLVRQLHGTCMDRTQKLERQLMPLLVATRMENAYHIISIYHVHISHISICISFMHDHDACDKKKQPAMSWSKFSEASCVRYMSRPSANHTVGAVLDQPFPFSCSIHSLHAVVYLTNFLNIYITNLFSHDTAI